MKIAYYPYHENSLQILTEIELYPYRGTYRFSSVNGPMLIREIFSIPGIRTILVDHHEKSIYLVRDSEHFDWKTIIKGRIGEFMGIEDILGNEFSTDEAFEEVLPSELDPRIPQGFREETPDD